MAVTERSFALQAKRGERKPMFFGRRLPAGTVVTVFETEAAGRTWAFETAAEAAAFDAADWPKPLHGRWLTSDNVLFPDSKRAMAEAREANLTGGAR